MAITPWVVTLTRATPKVATKGAVVAAVVPADAAINAAPTAVCGIKFINRLDSGSRSITLACELKAPSFRLFQIGNFAPFALSGSVRVESESDLQSAGLIMRHVLWADFERNFRIDLLGGYRFFQLDENLTITDTRLIPPLGGDPQTLETT